MSSSNNHDYVEIVWLDHETGDPETGDNDNLERIPSNHHHEVTFLGSFCELRRTALLMTGIFFACAFLSVVLRVIMLEYYGVGEFITAMGILGVVWISFVAVKIYGTLKSDDDE